MDRLLLVTWNVAGLDERSLDERTEAQCLSVLLRPEPPDVVMLQEVVRRSWHAHWKHHLAHAGYDVVPADPTAATDSSYFAILAVRRDHPIADSGVVPFPGSRMGRQLVWADTGGWWLGTGHLESERGGARERIRQLGSVVGTVAGWPGPAVFAGDTNLRVEEEPRVEGLSRVIDPWVALGRDPASKVTWRGGARSLGARFDRVYHSTAAVARRLWTEPASGASDHDAVWTELATTAAATA
ncbi:MAG: endonuclease/exonuclease/phosphatase family protein [Myxococcota bacterium]